MTLPDSKIEAQVEEENFHQFTHSFYKEKEMADFRRWIYALVVVALLAGLTVPASANAPPFTNAARVSEVPIAQLESKTMWTLDIRHSASTMMTIESNTFFALAPNGRITLLAVPVDPPGNNDFRTVTIILANTGQIIAGNANTLNGHSVTQTNQLASSQSWTASTVNTNITSTSAVANRVVSARFANNVYAVGNVTSSGTAYPAWVTHGGTADANETVASSRPTVNAATKSTTPGVTEGYFGTVLG